jgi:polyphenol oxidase
MSEHVFLRSPQLLERGVEHGFGTRLSRDAAPRDCATVRQVHGTDVRRAPLGAGDASADALWTSQPGLAVAVRTADCVPILLVDQRSRGVAAVHAGWRGSAARMAEHAVRVLAQGIDATPAELVAVIGPHIGPCCYEVDEPVMAAVDDPGVFRAAGRSGHAYLDLRELNRRQLLRAGLAEESIWFVEGCTSCDARFDSYRRDRGAGRMLHYVRMNGDGP